MTSVKMLFCLLQDLPFYPANGLNTSSSHDINTGNLEKPYSFGFRGVVTEDEYQSLLKQKWFGRDTPLDFHGYNNYPDFWPFWCSEPYTYVTSMLALAKFSNTVDVEELNVVY